VKGSGDATPRSSVRRHTDGSIIVVVDIDGGMPCYRSRSHDKSEEDLEFELVG
jgi:hypothetical protein